MASVLAERNLVVALDVDTWRTHAAAFDARGHCLARETTRHEALTPASGLAELPVQALWEAARDTLRAVVRALGAERDRIAAVGVSGDPYSFVPLGENGQPLHNMILRQDQRALKAAETLAARFSAQEFYRVTGRSHLSAGALPAKLCWLARHAPAVFARAKRFALPQDLLLARLGGEAVVERATATHTGLFHLERDSWWGRLLEFLETAPSQWPFIVSAGAVAGTISAAAAAETGLPPAVSLVAGTTIQMAAALGAGILAPGQMLVSTFFDGIATLTVVDRMIFDSRLRVSVCPYPAELWTAAPMRLPPRGMLSWYRQTFCPELAYPQLDEMASQIPAGCDGLAMVLHPAPFGAPRDANSSLHGLAQHHGQAHVVRAILEAEACAVRQQVELLRRLKAPVHAVRVAGRSASSDLWMQIRADIIGVPVERPQVADCAALGTAMCAAVGGGLYETVRQATRAMHHNARAFEPDPTKRQLYEHLYRRYERLSAAIPEEH